MGVIDDKSQGLIIDLITGQDFTTDILQGKLSSLIIDSDVEVSVTIHSELGYLIYHNSQHKGVHYYAPRAVLQGPITNIMVMDQFEKFLIIERLNILVNGPTNENVRLILRFE